MQHYTYTQKNGIRPSVRPAFIYFIFVTIFRFFQDKKKDFDYRAAAPHLTQSEEERSSGMCTVVASLVAVPSVYPVYKRRRRKEREEDGIVAFPTN